MRFKQLVVVMLIVVGLWWTGAQFWHGTTTTATATWAGELPTNTTWSLAGSPYTVTDALVVPTGIALTITSGVNVRFAPSASLHVHGRLYAVGVPTQPITFTWRDINNHWGMLSISNTLEDSIVSHAIIEHAGEALETASPSYGITVQGGRLTMRNSIVREMAKGGIYINDNATLTLLDSEIHHTSGHCINLHTTGVTVTRNRLHHCGDTGISISASTTGQHPQDAFASLDSNLIYATATGIAVKDGALAHIQHATLVSNATSLMLYEDHIGYGGGIVTLANAIIWESPVPITLDTHSTLSVTFSNIEGVWPGQGNIAADPHFLPDSNYRLAANSPCRDVGTNVLTSTSDLDNQLRPVGPAPDLGAYEWPVLRLTADVGDSALWLHWQTPFLPSLAHHYVISYTATQTNTTLTIPHLITDLITSKQAYTLTRLNNNLAYKIVLALHTANNTPLMRSNTLVATPGYNTSYIPLVIVQEPPPPPPNPVPTRYDLTITPENLAYLDAHVKSDDPVPALFTHAGITYTVGVHYRGEIARLLPKKSWNIEFEDKQLFRGWRELNINAEYPDKSLMREYLSYDLYKRAGFLAPQAEFIQLYVNGAYWGLYTQVEEVDKRFLATHGLDPNGNLYKGDYGSFHLADSYNQYVSGYEKKTNEQDSYNDIIAFVEMLNETSPSALPAMLAEVLDIDTYLDWYAVHTLLGNFEWVEKNYYVHHDLQTDRWQFIPWDLDMTFGHNYNTTVFNNNISWDNPIDAGTQQSPKQDGDLRKWNKVTDVILQTDEFRSAYCRRLRELLHDEFTYETMAAQVDTAFALIQPYGEADPQKWGNTDEFYWGPEELKHYVRKRREWLLLRLPYYCTRETDTTSIHPHFNEVLSVNNASTPWLELHNPSLVNVDMGGMILEHTPALTGTTEEWLIPTGTTILPKGFMLIWAGDAVSEENTLRASFHLNKTGGRLVLYDKPVHEGKVLDALDYGALPPNVSFGLPEDDSTHAPITLTLATPGYSNLGHVPVILNVTQLPMEPDAGQYVTITATISDAESALEEAWLTYDTGTETYQLAMSNIDPISNTYQVTLPAQITGTVVSYTIHARDATALLTKSPAHGSYRYRVGFHRPPLYINELLALNVDGLEDEYGDKHDWFEIYNAGSAAVDLSGMYFTDALENTRKWTVTTGITVPPGSYILFWADNEPVEGATHMPFKLDANGERLALYASDANYNELIDEVYFGPQVADLSMGRYPDGGPWHEKRHPTPGKTNR